MVDFHWENVEQFISFVNLLCLRNGGQLRPKDEKVTIDDGEDLKRQFLDSLAVVLSPVKGGRNVTCVALRQKEDKDDPNIILLVSRNEAFRDVDTKFCKMLQKRLSAIAASANADSDHHVDGDKDIFWEELLHYNKPRSEYYVGRFQKRIQAFKREGLQKCVPSYDAVQASLARDGVEARAELSESRIIGPYSEVTHEAYMKFAQARIAELENILLSSDGIMCQGLLAEKAYSMRHMMSIKLLLKSSPNGAVACKLFSDILFLGRLRACYSTLIRAAQNIAGFSNLSVELVLAPSPRKAPASLPTLPQTLEYLGMPSDPASVKKYANPKLIGKATDRAFNRLQRNMTLHTHAEVQLILFLAKSASVETLRNEMFPYIGCSKLTCFLCSAFLKSFRLGGIVLETRGCHGKVYGMWSVPDVNGLQDGVVGELYSALKQMRNLLAREIITPIKPVRHAAESSANVSVDQPEQSACVQAYRKILAAQRECDVLRNQMCASDPELAGEAGGQCATTQGTGSARAELLRATSDPYSVDGMNTQNASSASNDRILGFCEECDAETMRKCSKCSGPWLCGEECEAQYAASSLHHRFTCSDRPLNTADYFALACANGELPDDFQTLEDYGFTKFASFYDQSKLFGLYIRLLSELNYDSDRLHQWQMEGRLVGNIITTYEKMPIADRGPYYPWFCENLHIFTGERAGPSDLFAGPRQYLNAPDRSRNPCDLTPDAKRMSFFLYALLLNGWRPDPNSSSGPYLNFGFCTTRHILEEAVLGELYRDLISRCSFEEFWTAYQSRDLVALFNAKGLRERHQKIKHLGTFLNIKPGAMRHSVWDLRLFTLQSDIDPPRPVAADYGFVNCETAEEMSALKNAYCRVFDCPRFDAMKLHAACIKGKLYDFACRHHPCLQQRFRKLMKNPYPLLPRAVDVKSPGMCAENVALVIGGAPGADCFKRFWDEHLSKVKQGRWWNVIRPVGGDFI